MAKFLWTQKQDIGPAARRAHAMAYDSNRGRSVLFGGITDNQLFNDTWEWDGELWTQAGDIGPTARHSHAMAYDMNRTRTVLFGGMAGNQFAGDTWEWDGELWTQLSNSGPQSRIGHALVYNNATKRIILFGGESSTGVLNDTWEFDGEEWVQLEDTGPSPRKLHSMAYDSLRNRVVLYGGTNNVTGFNDTWEWNGETWTQVTDIGPPPCLGGSMAFMNGMVALFGGISAVNGNSQDINDNTWGWNGSHWTQFQDIGPAPRWRHAAVFDTKRSRLMVFGGLVTAENPLNADSFVGDTWEHTDTSATPPTPPGPQEVNVTLAGINLDPNSTTISAVDNVNVTVLLNSVSNAVVTVHMAFFGDSQAGLPSNEQTFIPLNQIDISPGMMDGNTTLAGSMINESGTVFAAIADNNGETQSVVNAILEITGP